MNSLAGYLAAICVSVVATYLSQFLRPKVKIRYWLSHSFIYTIPNNLSNPAPNSTQIVTPEGSVLAPAATSPTSQLLTQALTIQNFGRESAAWIEIAHRRKPDFFQLHPALNYTESTGPSGEHILKVESLASKEFFTIQFLGFTQWPDLAFIRSPVGHASPMPWIAVRKYPSWVILLARLVAIIGAALCAYWIIRGGIFAFKRMGWF
jgi:hypothetical protein